MPVIGPAITTAVFVADNPVEGDHTYELAPPLAVSVCVSPEAMITLVGAMLIAGTAFTVLVITLLLKDEPAPVATLL